MAEYRKPCGRHGDSSASPEFIAYPLHARCDIHVRWQGLLALSNLPVVAAQTSAIGILVGVLLFVFSVPVIAKSSAAHSHSRLPPSMTTRPNPSCFAVLHILMKKFREAKKKLAVFDEEDSEDEDG